MPASSLLTSGVGTFSATLVTAGSQTLTVTDSITSNITGQSGPIVVSAAAASHFTVSASGTASAGAAFGFTVTAPDPFNNVATGYGGSVAFSSSDHGASTSLPANSDLSSGVGTFSATLTTAGAETLTATDSASSSITGHSGTITVSAAAATHFTVTAPSAATAGTGLAFTVTALDPFNNAAISYGGTVVFASSDAAGTVPGNATLVNGAGTFSATFTTAGGQTLTATDTTSSSITGHSDTITVSAATTTHFAVTAPAAATAGTSLSFTVMALDQFNNTATAYGGTVVFASSDAAGTVPSNSTLTNGTGTFSATFTTAGSQTLTATDKTTSSITGQSGTITVSAAAATHFAVNAPSAATAGSGLAFTVTALDQFNNTAIGYGGTVVFASSDAGATVPANSRRAMAPARLTPRSQPPETKR